MLKIDQAQFVNDQRVFEFTSKPRKFDPVTTVLFRWPSNASAANEYVSGWKEVAGYALAEVKLSKATMEFIASHLSRKDGTCRMTDAAIAARTGRSLASTKRDIHRLKMLGYIVADYLSGDSRQERVRVLKICLPEVMRSHQRIPQPNHEVVASTYPPYVDPLDMGDRGNV